MQTDLTDIKSNITLSSCDEVNSICADFFGVTGISYFNFVRAFDDGSRISLSNNFGWMSFVMSNHQHYNLVFEETTEHVSSNCLIWDLIKGIRGDALITIARKQYNIDHGCTLIARHENYTEFYYFGTGQSNFHINIFYVNNIDLLQAFTLYFKDKASHIINKAEKSRLLLDGHSFFWLEKNLADQAKRDEFFKACDIGRYFLNGELDKVYLSSREAECLVYMFDGKAPKDIAKVLGISHRTVESYIEKAKLKMQCTYRGELLEKAQRCGFTEIYNTIKAKNHGINVINMSRYAAERTKKEK